eukprot:scaffold381_cov168-Ochromonas_danica.AAC.4
MRGGKVMVVLKKDLSTAWTDYRLLRIVHPQQENNTKKQFYTQTVTPPYGTADSRDSPFKLTSKATAALINFGFSSSFTPKL